MNVQASRSEDSGIAAIDYVARAGVSYVKSYDEKLFKDFMRTVESEKTDNIIELLAKKDK